MRNESHAGKKGHKEGPHSTHCDDAIWQQTKKKKNQSQVIYSLRFFLKIKRIKNNFSKKKISLIILILI
jgi:hypothetical protein